MRAPAQPQHAHEAVGFWFVQRRMVHDALRLCVCKYHRFTVYTLMPRFWFPHRRRGSFPSPSSPDLLERERLGLVINDLPSVESKAPSQFGGVLLASAPTRTSPRTRATTHTYTLVYTAA